MSKLPLEGIRVVDLSQIWAGPLATRLLADMGAEVIHIEACQRMDGQRSLWLAENEAKDKPWERGYATVLHRNKLGITLNLSKPIGIEICKRLIKISDIVLENYSPRVMGNFGMSYQDLIKIKPDIIMISMSAFGQTGTYRNFIGTGTVMQGVGGLTELSGWPDRPPKDVDAMLSDAGGGFYGAGAVMTALLYRDRTGKGQYIDLGQVETCATLVGGEVMDYTLNGRVQGRIGNRHNWLAPHSVYRCKGDDQWVAITVQDEEEWQALCKVMRHPAWTKDERFADMAGRWQNQDELDKNIEKWTSKRDHMDIMHTLQAAGVTAAAVMNSREVVLDEHNSARKFFPLVDHPEVGKRPMSGIAYKLSKTPGSIRKPAPLLGEDNELVLGGMLGMTKAEIEQLAKDEIIGNHPIPMKKQEVTPLSTFQKWGIIAEQDPDYLEKVRKL